MPWPVSRPAALEVSVLSSASIASANAMPFASSVPTSWSTIWPISSISRDLPSGVRCRAVADTRNRAGSRYTRPDGIGFCAGQWPPGVTGNLDEGEPNGLPGTYLNSVYDVQPLTYGEPGYGYPESGQAIVNVTNGKLIRLLVDDEPFDVRYGQLLTHERILDLRAGNLLATRSGGRPPGRQCGLARFAWFRSPSEPSLPSVMK